MQEHSASELVTSIIIEQTILSHTLEKMSDDCHILDTDLSLKSAQEIDFPMFSTLERSVISESVASSYGSSVEADNESLMSRYSEDPTLPRERDSSFSIDKNLELTEPILDSVKHGKFAKSTRVASQDSQVISQSRYKSTLKSKLDKTAITPIGRRNQSASPRTIKTSTTSRVKTLKSSDKDAMDKTIKYSNLPSSGSRYIALRPTSLGKTIIGNASKEKSVKPTSNENKIPTNRIKLEKPKVEVTKINRPSSVTKSRIPQLQNEPLSKPLNITVHNIDKGREEHKSELVKEGTEINRKADKRPHSYMQSTLSRNLKIEQSVTQVHDSKRRSPEKNKKETNNINARVKYKAQKLMQPAQTKSYERKTIASSKKVQLKEHSPARSIERSESSAQSSPSRSNVLMPRQVEVNIINKSTSKFDNKALELKKISPSKQTVSTRLIQIPMPSASPTKLKKKIRIEEHIVKTDSEPRTVNEFTRSQSAIPSIRRDRITDDGDYIPKSLPGSPIRTKSANGSRNGTEVITSEVFTSHTDTGSIEVVYRQPYENLKKIGGRMDIEMSLIDTTDSSLSESVALPSSSSDHDLSSETNNRIKATSPLSPKLGGTSLQCIQEGEYRVSDLLICDDSSSSSVGDRSQNIEAATVKSIEYREIEEANVRGDVDKPVEARLSPILDVESHGPSRRKHKFTYVQEKSVAQETSEQEEIKRPIVEQAPQKIEQADKKEDSKLDELEDISYESALLTEANRNNPLYSSFHNDISYGQIDLMLDKMLIEVDKHQDQEIYKTELNFSEALIPKNCLSEVELVPSVNALIEIPIEEGTLSRSFESISEIEITDENIDNCFSLVCFNNAVQCKHEESLYDTLSLDSGSTTTDPPPALVLADNESIQHSAKIGDINMKWDDSSNDEECDYEPIEAHHFITLMPSGLDSSISTETYWDIANRNLSIVPEEDEDFNSYAGSYSSSNSNNQKDINYKPFHVTSRPLSLSIEEIQEDSENQSTSLLIDFNKNKNNSNQDNNQTQAVFHRLLIRTPKGNDNLGYLNELCQVESSMYPIDLSSSVPSSSSSFFSPSANSHTFQKSFENNPFRDWLSEKWNTEEVVESKINEDILDATTIVNIDKKPRKNLLKNIKAYISKSFDTDSIKKRSFFGRQKSVQVNNAGPLLKETPSKNDESYYKNVEMPESDEYSHMVEKANTLINDIVENSERTVNMPMSNARNGDDKINAMHPRDRTVSFSDDDYFIKNNKETLDAALQNTTNRPNKSHITKQRSRDKSVSFSESDDIFTSNELDDNDSVKTKKEMCRNNSVCITGSDDNINFLNDCINNIQDEILAETCMPSLRKQSILEDIMAEETEPLLSTGRFVTDDENIYKRLHGSNENISYTSSETDDGSLENLYNLQEEGNCNLNNSDQFDKTPRPDLIYEPNEEQSDSKKVINSDDGAEELDPLDPLALMPAKLFKKINSSPIDKKFSKYTSNDASLKNSKEPFDYKSMITDIVDVDLPSQYQISKKQIISTSPEKLMISEGPLDRDKNINALSTQLEQYDCKITDSQNIILNNEIDTTNSIVDHETADQRDLNIFQKEENAIELHTQNEDLNQSTHQDNQNNQESSINECPGENIPKTDTLNRCLEVSKINLPSDPIIEYEYDSSSVLDDNDEVFINEASESTNSKPVEIENLTPYSGLSKEPKSHESLTDDRIINDTEYKIMYDEEELIDTKPLLINAEDENENLEIAFFNLHPNFESEAISNPCYECIYVQNGNLEPEPRVETILGREDGFEHLLKTPTEIINEKAEPAGSQQIMDDLKNDEFLKPAYKILYDQIYRQETEPLLSVSVGSEASQELLNSTEQMINNVSNSNLFDKEVEIHSIDENMQKDYKSNQTEETLPIIEFDQFLLEYGEDDSSVTGSHSSTVVENNNNEVSHTDPYKSEISEEAGPKLMYKKRKDSSEYEFLEEGYNFFTGYDALLQDNNISLADSISEHLTTPTASILTPESCYKQLTLTSEPSSLTPIPKPRSTKPSDTIIDSSTIQPLQLVDIDQSDVQFESAPLVVSASSIESDSENYYDKKKFWESKEQDEQIMGIKKRFTLHEDSSADIIKIVDKSQSIHEVSLEAPTPKPRSSTSIDRRKSDIFEEDAHVPPVTEYQAQFKDHVVITSILPEPKAQYLLEKESSTDSDVEGSGQFNVSSGYDNTGYISDSGDVEHYISDSEIEDRVPQIRERQMSVFQPNVTAPKNICLRSASLPTEDMYEVSADSIKLRKLYYEEQIKKEMVEDQMMTEIEEEDVSQQEHKTLEVKRELYEPSGVKSVPETTAAHESDYDMLNKSKTEIENKLEEMYKKEMKDEAIFLESDRIECVTDVVGETDTSYQERDIEDYFIRKDDSIKEVPFDNVYQLRSDISKPSDSLEVHVDKSEIEDSEKMNELDQDATDIDTKSLDSTELSPKTIFNSDLAPSNNIELKILSPIRQSVENITTTVWEAPIIHAQGTFDEKTTDILIVEKAPGHERDDELSVGTREESDLGSEIHQDHSDSYSSDRIKSESHDIEKLILESLHHQKISPEEAQIIASELIADIELEIQRRHSIPADVVEPPAPEYAKNQVSEYLQHLAEAKGLDSREIELVQSVLARKHRELAKLSRDDTQASSMEITDEELRYSGADYSPSGSRINILEEQTDQLKAEKVSDLDLKSFETKTEMAMSITKTTKTTIIEEDESLLDISSSDKSKIESEVVIDKIPETTSQPAMDVEPLKIEIKRGVEFHIGDEKIIIEKQHQQSKPAPKEVSVVETEPTVGYDFSPITSPVKTATGEVSSDPEPAFKKKFSDIDTSSSSSKKSNRKSGLEIDTYSSSGESHYHSFEVDSGKSRPCSSDVEVLIAAGSSDYESALASQDTSTKSHITSVEYVTAVSSISSKESMKSLDSESSGNLASVEVSEASETLVASEFEYNDDVPKKSALKTDAVIQRQATDESEFDFDLRDSPDISEEDLLDDKNIEEVSTRMKRCHEMIFPTDMKSPQADYIDDKLGTSLDDGSVLSVSLSSTSSLAQTRTTIIENIHSDQQSFGSLASLEDITGRSDVIGNQQSPAMSAINLSTSTKTLHEDATYDSVTLITSRVEHEGIQSVSTQVTSIIDTKAEEQKFPESKISEIISEPKKKCHRRNESTSSFTPERIIYSKDKEFILDSQQTSAICKQKTEESDIAIELKKKFTPDVVDKHRLDKRDSHTKSSTTSSERSSFEEAEAEAAFNMVAHISPVHKIKQICPIIEDETAEKNELEAREQAEREIEKNRALNKESAAFIPDIKVTQHMAPMERDGFTYPDLEIEEKDEESQNTTPQTPASISSKSSDSTDQGCEYILDDSRMSIIEESDGSQSVEDKMVESKSEAATIIEKTIRESDRETESPGSDSFELIEKPDIIDDFVVIEEVAKEAQETDAEGKSMTISKQKYIKKHDTEVEKYLVQSEPSNKLTGIQYYPHTQQRHEELGFEFEESPPQADAKEQQTKYVQEFDRELEENKKWIEQQFLGDQPVAGYGYEMDFERGPLEDIKEEDGTDIDSSRIGSLSSHKESGGSLGSVKDSYSSTPEYDVLAGRKYFTKSGENDDISMSSLQEFENLERAMSLENRKFHQGSNSSSNGSFKNRYTARSGAGDEISGSSLKEFEGLEKACIAAHTIEQKVIEEEAMLSQIEECQESIISETESCETFSGTDRKLIPDSDEEDYEKRMFEIDEIIRQAQTNVEHFIDFKEGERTESIGRGDSVEEVSKVPDLDLDMPIKRIPIKPPPEQIETDDLMIQSTDSLDVKLERQLRYSSSDSLNAEQKIAADLMTDSTDSIEFNARKLSRATFSSDSIEARIVESDSLDLAAAVVQSVTQLSDSIDEDGSRIVYRDNSTASTGKDFSLSAKEDITVGFDTKGTSEFMLESCDSIASTSTATYAHQHESDSIYSGSCTSGDSNTMVSSTDTIDPIMSASAEVSDASVGTRKIWFDEDTSGAGRMYTTEYYDDGARTRITETVEQEPEQSIYSHTVKRTVEMPPQIVKMTFSGSDAQSQLEKYIESLAPAESVEETEEVDADGNLHIKRVVKKTVIMTDTKAIPEGQGVISRTLTDEHGSKTIFTQAIDLDKLDQTVKQKSIAGMSSQGESSQALRSEQELQKEDQSKSQTEARQGKDQQELSQEMKDILKALDEDSYK